MIRIVRFLVVALAVIWSATPAGAQTSSINSILVSSTTVGPGENMVTGFVSAFIQTPTMTQMTITNGNVGTKLVYYGDFPLNGEQMRGTTRTFLIDRAMNPANEHLVKKVLIAGPPSTNKIVYPYSALDMTSTQIIKTTLVHEPVIILKGDEITVEGTISARLHGPDGTLVGIIAQLRDGTQATINGRLLINEDEKDFVFVVKRIPGPTGERTIVGMLRPIKR